MGLGLTVPRRVGKAVARNRVKRRLREIFRRHRAELNPPMDIVVNVRPTVSERSYDELEREFLSSHRRLARKVR